MLEQVSPGSSNVNCAFLQTIREGGGTGPATRSSGHPGAMRFV
jgi:hypothetical protein